MDRQGIADQPGWSVAPDAFPKITYVRHLGELLVDRRWKVCHRHTRVLVMPDPQQREQLLRVYFQALLFDEQLSGLL